MDYHLQFMEFISLLQTRGLSNEVCEIFPFSKNVDYHMQFQEILSLQKHGLSYEICGISFPSLKTCTIICNFWNYFPLSKNVAIISNLRNFFLFTKNEKYYMQF